MRRGRLRTPTHLAFIRAEGETGRAVLDHREEDLDLEHGVEALERPAHAVQPHPRAREEYRDLGGNDRAVQKFFDLLGLVAHASPLPSRSY